MQTRRRRAGGRVPRVGGAARVARLRDRRRGREGRTTSSVQRSLGVVGREPRGAIAWKFTPMTATTTLRRVMWNVGRTGHMVPFAELEPVQVTGRDGEAGDAPQRGGPAPQGRPRGRRGDHHARRRRDPAGGVADAEGAEAARAGRRCRRRPQKCPSCGTPTVKPEGGVWTICPNRASCPGQLFQAVKHFVSRGAMDIEGLGEERAQQLLEAGLIGNVADIYELTRGEADRARRLGRDLGERAGRVDRAVQGSSRSRASSTGSGSRGSAS